MRAFLAHSPRDSAYYRATHADDWFLTVDLALLREIEHGIRILAWQQTRDAQREHGHQHFPERHPLTPAERAEAITKQAARGVSVDGTPVGAPSLALVKKWLGWEKPAPALGALEAPPEQEGGG